MNRGGSRAEPGEKSIVRRPWTSLRAVGVGALGRLVVEGRVEQRLHHVRDGQRYAAAVGAPLELAHEAAPTALRSAMRSRVMRYIAREVLRRSLASASGRSMPLPTNRLEPGAEGP